MIPERIKHYDKNLITIFLFLFISVSVQASPLNSVDAIKNFVGTWRQENQIPAAALVIQVSNKKNHFYF